MNKKTAEIILNRLNYSLGNLNEVLVDTHDLLSVDEAIVIRRAIAKIMNIADSEITLLISNQYPELNPLTK